MTRTVWNRTLRNPDLRRRLPWHPTPETSRATRPRRLPLLRHAAIALLTAATLALALACAGVRPAELKPLPAAPQPRLLFFALDSVPYRLVAELTDPARGRDALLQGFSHPIPLISSFPSTSSIAFTGILEPFDLPRPPGYEARFFDREANAIRGGGLVSYYKIGFPWREFFTWTYDDPVRRAFATARPARSSAGEVRWVLDAFAHSDEPQFFGYVALTDGTAHLKGPAGLEVALAALDDGLRRLRGDRPDRPFYTVLYSDHGIAGGEPLINVRQAVKEALHREGFRLTQSLRRPGDAVMVPFGLVSSFEVYLEDERGLEVAEALARVAGVDLCVARRPQADGWEIFGAASRAAIETRSDGPQQEWAYLADRGDPLEYSPVVDELRRRAGDPAATWFPDAWWFAAAWDHRYPDALHRISRTFDLVANTASVVCSLAPGYMYGAWKTDVAARLSTGRLHWTHGALYREASRGFLMTDLPGWQLPPAVRFDQALEPFAHLDGEQLARLAREEPTSASPSP